MGEVYLAKSVGAAGFQKHVVIKKILPHLVEHPQTVKSLVREAKLLVMLNHPNIVQVLDLGVEGTDYFMAMEYVHGYNLSTVLHYCSKKKLLIPAEACALIALELLSALSYAHELKTPDGQRQNVIHRDVSPQNVMITYDGRVKLTDFGIAKVLSEAEDELTQSLKGKWRYMAPEAVEGRRIDQRYDLFAVGIILFESLCRRNLFGGKRDVDILNKVREAKIPAITNYYPDLPQQMVAVTERSLKKDPEQRYQTAKEFAADLREAILPYTETEAASELSEFVADLYKRSDYPINKPKIVDPNAEDVNATRSIVLKSRLSELDRTPPSSRRAGRSGGVFFLTVVLILICGVVAFLAYKILYGDKFLQPQPKDPVIIVNQRKPDAQVPVEPDATTTANPVRPDAKTKRPPGKRLPRAKPFTPAIGARAFRKYQPALMRCFTKHSKPEDPEVSLKVTSTIRGSGRVERVDLEPAAMSSSPLGRCVVKVAKRARYPRHDKPSIKFLQPIRLRNRNR
jgi:serine/threonine protein kinase